MMEGRVLEHLDKEYKVPTQLFTYYQGDINTAVDEHFFRALNKANIPKDLSTKTKERSRPSKSDAASSSSSWASSWSKSTYSTSGPKLTQLSEGSPQPQGVIMNPQGLTSSSLWPCPSRQSSSFELPQIVYQQPSAEGNASYMNLLQMERPARGLMISPFTKSDTRPEWNGGTASGRGIGLDSGVPVTEMSKDLYWY